MARFIDYKPTEKPGLYMFRDDTGQERLLFGDAAAPIKEGIDRNKQTIPVALGEGRMKADEWNALALGPEQKPMPAPAPDERTAAAVEVPESMRYTGPGATKGGTLPAKSDVAPNMKGTPVPEVTGPTDQRGVHGKQKPVAATPAAGAPPPQDNLVEYAYDPKTGQRTYLRSTWDAKQGKYIPMDPREPGAIVIEDKYRPGSAGTKGGMQLAGISQEGKLLDPGEDYYDKRWEATGDQQESVGLVAGAEAQEAQGTADILKRRSQELLDNEMREKFTAQRIEQQVNDVLGEVSRLNQEIGAHQYDPDRIYSGEGGSARKARHVISSLFSGFGSALTKTPNVVAQRIRDQINTDIQAQENDLIKRKDLRDSALVRFRDLTGSLDAAKTAVRKMQTDRAIVQLEREAALARTPKAKAAAEGAKAVLEKEALDYEAQLKQQTAGSVSKQYKYVPGTPGRAASGGPASQRAPSADERKDIIANVGADKKGGKISGPAAGPIVQTVGYLASVAEGRKQLEAQLAKDPTLLKRNMAPFVGAELLRAPANMLREGAGERMFRTQEELEQLQDFEAAKNQITSLGAQLLGSGTPQAFEASSMGQAIAKSNSYEELIRYYTKIENIAQARINKLESLGDMDAEAEQMFFEGEADPRMTEGAPQ